MKAHLLTIRGRTRTRNFTGVDGVTDNFVEALLSGGGAVAHRVAAVQESASRTSREPGEIPGPRSTANGQEVRFHRFLLFLSLSQTLTCFT
jgi:hypothetical protein